MAREPNLTVRLEAKIRDFERQMERATRTADRQFTQIETRASAMSGRLAGIGKAAFAGFAAGAVAALAPMAVFNNAMKTLADASNMAKAADRVGLTTKAFQELQFGMSLAGVEAATFQTGMEQFTKRMGDAATKGGTLAKILEANGVAIRDTNGNIRTSESLLRDYANLIKNAGSEQEQLVLATEAFGRSAGAAFVTALRNGESAIDDFAKATEDAGGVIDDELLRRAEILDDRFESMWQNFSTQSASAMLTAITWMDDFITKAGQASQALSNFGNNDFFKGVVGWLDDNGLMSLDINRGLIDEAASRREVSAMQDRVAGLSQHVKSLRAIGEDATVAEGQLAEAQARLNQRLREITSGTATTGGTALPAITVTGSDRPTVMPGGSDKKKGGGGRDKALVQAMREAEAVLRVIESLQAERAEIGMTDVERAKANALRAAGAAATTEQAAEIMNLIDAIYAERDALDEANRAMEEMRDLGRDAMGGFIEDMLNGAKATDALANALRNVGSRLLNSGLDMLFGTGGKSGGGILSLLGFANGGYTGDGGKYQVAGAVHKGEYVFDKEATARIGVRNLEQLRKGFATGGYAGPPSLPRMQSSGAHSNVVVNFAPTIDARGADSAAVARLSLEVRTMKQALPGQVVKAVREARTGRQL